MRYHLNPATGNPNICRAQAGNCPYGEAAPHYSTKDEARRGFEEAQSEATLAKVQKKAVSRRDPRTGYLTQEAAAEVKLRDLHCSFCGAPYTDPAGLSSLLSSDRDECKSCEQVLYVSDIAIRFTPENPSHAFLSKEKVREATWYHMSYRSDWLETVDASSGGGKAADGFFEAHVGTEAAAFDRFLTEAGFDRNNEEETYHLYQVRLKPEATIADSIEKDTNQSQVGQDGSDVTRYYNIWEDSASISLAARSSSLEIVGKREVRLAEAYERLSPYNVLPKHQA